MNKSVKFVFCLFYPGFINIFILDYFSFFQFKLAKHLDFFLTIIENVQQSVFYKFLCHSCLFWKIVYYKLVQMQQVILMQQLISENFFQYSRITCSKICDDEY